MLRFTMPPATGHPPKSIWVNPFKVVSVYQRLIRGHHGPLTEPGAYVISGAWIDCSGGDDEALSVEEDVETVAGAVAEAIGLSTLYLSQHQKDLA